MYLKTGQKYICMLYLPAIGRSFGKGSLIVVDYLLEKLEKGGFDGVYLIGLFADGGADNGFDVVDYEVNPSFGTNDELEELIEHAHQLDMSVTLDVIPNHVSNQHLLAQACLLEVPGFEDVLYVVDEETAKRNTVNGAVAMFGAQAYHEVDMNGKKRFVRNKFADGRMFDLNWESTRVQEYFRKLIQKFKRLGVDSVRVDCGMLLLEDVAKARPGELLSAFDPRRSVRAFQAILDDMPAFYEWFDPSTLDVFDEFDQAWALDCSYVATGQLERRWQHPKLVPLLGGHDQMTVADRGLDPKKVLAEACQSPAPYVFLDLATVTGMQTNPELLPDDLDFDADLDNPNQRYRGRRPFEPVMSKYLAQLWPGKRLPNLL